jgi:hypothetical protein
VTVDLQMRVVWGIKKFFKKCGENVLPSWAVGEINRAKSSLIVALDGWSAGLILPAFGFR